MWGGSAENRRCLTAVGIFFEVCLHGSCKACGFLRRHLGVLEQQSVGRDRLAWVHGGWNSLFRRESGVTPAQRHKAWFHVLPYFQRHPFCRQTACFPSCSRRLTLPPSDSPSMYPGSAVTCSSVPMVSDYFSWFPRRLNPFRFTHATRKDRGVVAVRQPSDCGSRAAHAQGGRRAGDQRCRL